VIRSAITIVASASTVANASSTRHAVSQYSGQIDYFSDPTAVRFPIKLDAKTL
jgi:hypothetical protein